MENWGLLVRFESCFVVFYCYFEVSTVVCVSRKTSSGILCGDKGILRQCNDVCVMDDPKRDCSSRTFFTLLKRFFAAEFFA